MTRTYTYSSSLYDLSGYTYNTAENTYYAGVDAYTAVYCGTGPYGTNSRYLDESQIPCDYVLAESYFNIDKLSGVSPLNITWNQFVTSVITHETGHMLGLGHPTYNSVMQQYGDKKIKYCINRKPSQSKNNSARSKGQIKRREHEKSSVRAKVEHVFAIVKGQLRYRKTRYRGLRKQISKLNMMFASNKSRSDLFSNLDHGCQTFDGDSLTQYAILAHF